MTDNSFFNRVSRKGYEELNNEELNNNEEFTLVNNNEEFTLDNKEFTLVKIDDPDNDLDDEAEESGDGESNDEQLASSNEPPQTLEEKASDSLQAVDEQLKLVSSRIDELNTIIEGSLAKAKKHAETIPIDYSEKEPLALGIAWLEKQKELQEKLGRSTNENVDDYCKELKNNLQRHDQIGIRGEILAKSKEGEATLTELGKIANSCRNAQFNQAYNDWDKQNNEIYSFCFNRKYELHSLNAQSKKLNSIKEKLDKYALHLEQSAKHPQSDEVEEEITENIEIANRYCNTSSEAARAEGIVQAVGGDLETEDAEFGLPLLGSDRPLENLSPTMKTVHGLTKTINNDLNQIRALQKGLQANPTSEYLKAEHETLLASLKKNFKELESSLNASQKAETLILLEQLQSFNFFFNRYHSLRDASFSRFERLFMTKALTQPSTPTDFKKLTQKSKLLLTDSHTHERYEVRDQRGEPLRVSNAIFLEALDVFVGSVKTTRKGNETKYRFKSQEDLKQFINLCMKKSSEENKKEQNPNKEDFSVREAKEGDENNSSYSNTQQNEPTEEKPLGAEQAAVREAPRMR